MVGLGKLSRTVCSDILSLGKNMEESAPTKWLENVLGWARVISFKLCQAWGKWWWWNWGRGGEMEGVPLCIGSIEGCKTTKIPAPRNF